MEKKDSFDISGERLTLGKSSRRNEEDHTARYEFCAPFVKGKVVLDIACGTGYGTKMMADYGAQHVVGVDIDPQSVEYARTHFSGGAIEYRCAAAGDIDFAENTFDVIVSFETIEHLEVEERSKYLEALKKSLKSDGTILLSTPNKVITSPWSEKPLNPYHVLEYYKHTLEDELKEHDLRVREWYGQRFVNRLFTYRLAYLLVRVVEKLLRKSFGIYDVGDGADVRTLVAGKEPRYFVLSVVR